MKINNLRELGNAMKKEGLKVGENLPDLDVLLGESKSLEEKTAHYMAAVEKAAKRLSFSKDMGKRKAFIEHDIKILQKVRSSGGILDPDDRECLESAYENLAKIDKYVRHGIDEDLRDFIEFFCLVEESKIAKAMIGGMSDLVNVEDMVKRAKEMGVIRIVGQQEKADMIRNKKIDRHLIVLNGIWYVPSHFNECDDEVSLFTANISDIIKSKKGSIVETMKKRATKSLEELIVGDGAEGEAYIYYPPVLLGEGKNFPEGHLLLEMIKDGEGAKLIIVEAAGRFAKKYYELKDKGRFLPLAFIRAGKIVSHIEDRDVFGDTRMFLMDVLRALGRKVEVRKDDDATGGMKEKAEETEEFFKILNDPAMSSALAE